MVYSPNVYFKTKTSLPPKLNVFQIKTEVKYIFWLKTALNQQEK